MGGWVGVGENLSEKGKGLCWRHWTVSEGS